MSVPIAKLKKLIIKGAITSNLRPLLVLAARMSWSNANSAVQPKTPAVPNLRHATTYPQITITTYGIKRIINFVGMAILIPPYRNCRSKPITSKQLDAGNSIHKTLSYSISIQNVKILPLPNPPRKQGEGRGGVHKSNENTILHIT
ncbi:MAG TPA: hypothetical protein DCL61_20435 [Cyanobacteria bacterium UBA12227]|nr:hypothetical protein [Cyanobacteria bacterium UBA12227]HAX85054.1 hypothetical protein [Cyanobacteria bacterium UBA11370]HBY80583.1 hypothetical protein [Cyanobacteria bacterium UBA11148]